MSVTFSVTPAPPVERVTLRFWCDDHDQVVPVGATELEAAAHALLCAECAGYEGPLADPVLPFEPLNLANANAAELLGLLGFDGDELYAGVIDATELLGRLLVTGALLAPSPELPDRVVSEPGRATLVDLGRPAGYLNDKVERLGVIARWAADHGASVCWA
jgi:hypothetical protein